MAALPLHSTKTCAHEAGQAALPEVSAMAACQFHGLSALMGSARKH